MGTLFLPLSKMEPIYMTRRTRLRVRVIYGCTKPGIIWQILIQISWKLALLIIFTQGIQKSTQKIVKMQGKYSIIIANDSMSLIHPDQMARWNTARVPGGKCIYHYSIHNLLLHESLYSVHPLFSIFCDICQYFKNTFWSFQVQYDAPQFD